MASVYEVHDLVAAGKLEKAEALAREQLNKTPNDPWAWDQAGIVHEASRSYALAVGCYRHALGLFRASTEIEGIERFYNSRIDKITRRG